MEVNPEAAYDSLCQIEIPNNARSRTVMTYRMLKAKAENKLYKQLPSDSVFSKLSTITIATALPMRRCCRNICWAAYTVTVVMHQSR